MAMKLDPVRLLIADDVGIGKTIEACLIAKELLERGELEREGLAVLCPPHLAQQWQQHLADMFHIDAELVLSSTVNKLERGLGPGESIFDKYPFLVISIDYIKSARHRDDFIRACPELVIVDEAHTCTVGGERGQGRQQRYSLIQELSKEQDRHLILVTATPHSGNESAFRSLLSHLEASFSDLPEDLDGRQAENIRKRLSRHLVQRRRANIRHYLDTDTAFPERFQMERSYLLSEPYMALFQKVLKYAREVLTDEEGGKRKQRIRYWSILSLLRSMASSPRAAASTLRNRAANADADDEAEIDAIGRSAVLDLSELDGDETTDITPGALIAADEGGQERERKRLLAFAKEAEQLEGVDTDLKIKGIFKEVKKLLDDGFHPILFCRFIPTAEYLAEELRKKFKKHEVEAITGTLSADERFSKIEALGRHEKRILVCTDCLSEGINLQDGFDAVIHYDLAWNPTRLEQREGRVDRFGQESEEVKILTYFGKDNGIDGVILDVLLRKNEKIRKSLGVSIALPVKTEEIVEAIFEGMVFREGQGANASQLELAFDDQVESKKDELHEQWERAADKEKKTRSLFAQHTISPEEVDGELQRVKKSIGDASLSERFLLDVLGDRKVPVEEVPKGHRFQISQETDRALRNAIGRDKPFTGKYDLPVDRSKNEIYLSRTSPIVSGVAAFVLGQALDEVLQGDGRQVAHRCGVARTQAVTEKTTLLLVRYRHHLIVKKKNQSRTLLAEELRTEAFTGPLSAPVWLEDDRSDDLMSATPSGNVDVSLQKNQLKRLLDQSKALIDHCREVGKSRAQQLLEDHTRVRESARVAGSIDIESVDPPDLLGAFILLPEDEV